MSLARWEHLAGRAFRLTREMNLLAGGAIRLAREMWNLALIAAGVAKVYNPAMPSIDEVKKLALDLPETHRADLAAHLLQSLPAVLHDEDDGVAEALRRNAELDANPCLGIDLEELRQRVRK